jgi:hypothetical protein
MRALVRDEMEAGALELIVADLCAFYASTEADRLQGRSPISRETSRTCEAKAIAC